MIINRYYPGEPINIHIQSLINITQYNNRVITTKKGKCKLPWFCGNGEQVIPIISIIQAYRQMHTRGFMVLTGAYAESTGLVLDFSLDQNQVSVD